MTTSAYRTDLAFIHDDGFGHIARGAAQTLIDCLVDSGLRGGVVAELACGSGISSRILVDVGLDVIGFDLSAEMIALARSTVPEGRFETASLYDVEIPQDVIAVTAIGEAFNYLFDPRAGFAAMAGVFARAFDALAPRGVLLFDVAQPGRALPRLEMNRFDGDGWHVTSEVVESPAERRLTRRIVSVRNLPDGDRREEEFHELALYDHEEVHAALTEAGFVPRSLASYSGEYLFGQGHGGFVAVKPG